MDIVTWLFAKDSLCSTCLSKNRRLTLVHTLEHVPTLLPDFEFGPYDKVCWECKAILKKMVMFYKRAHMAQALFEIAVKNGVIDNIQSLSQFNTFTTNVGVLKKCNTKENSDELSDIKLEQELSTVQGRDSDTDTCSDAEGLESVEIEPLETVTEGPKSDANQNPNFDIKMGKYYKDMFNIITLTESEVAQMREEKLKKTVFINSPRKCLKCLECFSSDRTLEKHAVRHENISGTFICKICEQRWLTKDQLDEHNKSHYISFACLFCKTKSTDLQNALQHHDLFHHIGSHKCKDCSETFQTRNLLYHHRRVHGAGISCPKCSKTFKYKYKLNVHMGTHKPGPKVECQTCHKKYRSSSGLWAHTRRCHRDKEDEGAFCVECNTRFSSAHSYRSHLKTSLKHNSVQDFKVECDTCGKRFGTKGSLRIHLQSHGDPNFKCDQCTLVFKTSGYLRRHVRLKHEDRQRERKHMCHICAKAFHEKSTLQQHLNAHRGYRPFVCDICSADFSHSGAMYTHKKLKHGYKKKNK